MATVEASFKFEFNRQMMSGPFDSPQDAFLDVSNKIWSEQWHDGVRYTCTVTKWIDGRWSWNLLWFVKED